MCTTFRSMIKFLRKGSGTTLCAIQPSLNNKSRKITTKNKFSGMKYRSSRKFFAAILLIALPLLTFAQVSVSLKDKPIRQVLKTIEKNSKYRFFYNDEFTALNKTVSINVNNVSIDAALKILFDSSVS